MTRCHCSSACAACATARSSSSPIVLPEAPYGIISVQGFGEGASVLCVAPQESHIGPPRNHTQQPQESHAAPARNHTTQSPKFLSHFGASMTSQSTSEVPSADSDATTEATLADADLLDGWLREMEYDALLVKFDGDTRDLEKLKIAAAAWQHNHGIVRAFVDDVNELVVDTVLELSNIEAIVEEMKSTNELRNAAVVEEESAKRVAALRGRWFALKEILASEVVDLTDEQPS